MKIAIYARVSKEEEGVQDPDNQLLPLRKYCEAKGWEVSEEFIDRCSGGTSDRPEFQRMLGRVKQMHFKAILVWSLDRFSREGMNNTLKYIETLKHYNCALVSLQETWLDTTQQGIGELLIGIFSWVAAEERRKISERTKAALTKLQNQGIKLGRPHKINKEQVISMYDDLGSINKVAKELNVSYGACWKIINAYTKL